MGTPAGAGPDLGELYRAARLRITELVRAIDDDAAVRTKVPACPEWSVHDLVAHLVGVTDDVTHGRLDGLATDPWTARQVDARRGASLEDLLAEWEANAAGFEDLIRAVDARQAVLDVATHEQDLRGALGVPRPVDDEVLDIVVPMLVEHLGTSAADAGLPVVRVLTPGAELAAGEAPVTLTVERQELFRAGLGRRSRAQIAALGWSADGASYVDHLAVFGPAAVDIIE